MQRRDPIEEVADERVSIMAGVKAPHEFEEAQKLPLRQLIHLPLLLVRELRYTPKCVLTVRDPQTYVICQTKCKALALNEGCDGKEVSEVMIGAQEGTLTKN